MYQIPYYLLCILQLTVAMAMANGRNTETVLRDGSDQFTAKMFYEIIGANPKQSIVLSALSVMQPLAELSLASVGESHNQLLAAIGTPDDEATKIVFSYANKRLKSTRGVTLNSANKIYIGSYYRLKSEFVAISRNVFDIEIQNIDFADQEEATNEINKWVEEQTNSRIKNLISPNSLSEDTKAVLINTIYFKGNWANAFHKNETKDLDFHVSKTNVIQIPMMYRRGVYSYVQSDELKSQIIEIPYKGYEASLVVVLPNEIDGIEELVKKLKDPVLINNALEQTSETVLELTIPKFKIETTTDLVGILVKMNVTKLFNGNEAKLYNMFEGDDELYVSSAIQKAFIEVDEEGTEAAAATGVVIGITATLVPEFNADRPFYFAIKTNSFTLFNGVMYGA